MRQTRVVFWVIIASRSHRNIGLNFGRVEVLCEVNFQSVFEGINPDIIFVIRDCLVSKSVAVFMLLNCVIFQKCLIFYYCLVVFEVIFHLKIIENFKF